ncbi:MAG TPA: DNA translocase FtsK [Acidobacteriaceae bacterium]|jgi:S-DNA-T family DNA segregation ATPase FtsK/SpoIIIE|nr:DNA translocase FtsK [Acidobacteriaceae bacterium]
MKPVQLVLTPTRNRRLNELVGLLVLASAILLLLALISYRPTDPSFDSVGLGPVRNWIGPFGAHLSDIFLQIEGVSAYLIPLLVGALGWTWLRSRPAGSPGAKVVGFGLCLVFAPALFGLLPNHPHFPWGLPVAGLTGRLVADLLVSFLNFTGACIVTVTLVAAAVYLSTTFSFNTAREWIGIKFAFVLAWRDRWVNWRKRRAMKKELRAAARLDRIHEKEAEKARKAAEKAARKAGKSVPVEAPLAVEYAGDEDDVPNRRGGFSETYAPAQPQPVATPMGLWDQMPRSVAEEPEELGIVEADPEPAAPLRPQLVPRAERAAERTAEPGRAISIGERADTDARTVTVASKSVTGFRLPPSTLLHRSDEPSPVREDLLRTSAQILVEKCAEFDVTGQVVQINPGPVVTTFEFRPDAGIKYSRVTGLAEDLCLATRAESILIERMAGKSTVGIQVPNDERETIWLRDVIESENFATSKSKLTLAMGKDINGRIVVADLATMPHVLIAGSTGSGKSVAINAMIMSVLYKATPEQVRLILVDPKRVELGMYEGVPHLFTPIITEPKLAANALRNAVREMERRLKLLASRSVRNIDQYNRLFDNATPTLFDEEQEEKPLPYIMIIIDELADLMMLDKANVEESVTRLAQMARAVGIHLVLATQRPSVDVITGLIKANVPSRISFRLATKVDSRTILDSNGAEALLGRGDMLFLPPGTSRLNRIHAPFVTEKEIAAVTDFWKKQGEAEYVQGFLEAPKDAGGHESGAGSDDGDDSSDDLFEDAVRLVLEFGKASTSLLQRRLRIGYGRAAHLIDMMERDGIVGPADGPKPREILKPPDWISEVETTLR